MFRQMRRHRQALSQEECVSVLHRASSGVLAVLGDEDYPYAVPVSFVFHKDKIYFHSALEGHKIDAIQRHAKVSFCVIDQDTVVPEKFTTHFRSVIAFGKAYVVQDAAEKLESIQALADKYSPGQLRRDEEIQGSLQRMHMVCIAIDRLTGKQAIELMKKAGE